MTIRTTFLAATFSATVVLVRLRAQSVVPTLSATAYVGRTANAQTYAAADYFAEDYAGSWVWVPV